MATDSSMDGVNTRLMEIYAAPLTTAPNILSSSKPAMNISEYGNGISSADTMIAVDSMDKFAQQLHQVSEENYGFAGEKVHSFGGGQA